MLIPDPFPPDLSPGLRANFKSPLEAMSEEVPPGTADWAQKGRIDKNTSTKWRQIYRRNQQKKFSGLG
jgi:hypothetical protein